MGNRSPAVSVLLFVGVLLVYLANGRVVGSGDTLPARYLPVSLLREHDADLDEFPFLFDERARRHFPLLDGIPYFLHLRDGHYLSAYSPGPALLALPVYAGPVLAGAPAAAWAPRLEKLSAAVITALSVLCLFWALAGLVALPWALGIAAVYALGTSSWSVSSQALWQHGPSQLCVALLLLCLVRGVHEERWLVWAGFAATAASCMRSTDALLALPVVAWIVYTRPRLTLRLVLLALPPLAVVAAYHAWYFGSVIGPAGHTTAPAWAFFARAPSAEGLGGVLWSPGRGLFVYSPVFILSVAGALVGIARGPTMLRPLGLGVVLVVAVVSQWFRWWGGYTWGPRLLADITPVLCVFLCPLIGTLNRHRLARAAFVALAALSIAAHGLGAFFYDARWDGAVDVDRDTAPLWSWSGGPLAFYGREAAAAGRLLFAEATDGPTSADSPALLAAASALEPTKSEVVVGEALAVSVTATNTGRAVWLAAAPGEKGTVSLGWRWSRQGVDLEEGRAPLRLDVRPGARVRFVERVAAPAVPGRYTLTIGLVSEHVAWFGDGGNPLRVAVRAVDLEGILTTPVAADERSPSATIAADRASYRGGDTIQLTVRLRNPDRPRQFDAYLVGRGPEGSVWFHDGQRLSRLVDDRWVAWCRALPMPAQATGRFAVPSAGLPAGTYRWHVVLTESGTFRVAARGATELTVRAGT